MVGIDGSPGSAAALQWAIEHADRLGRVIPAMMFTSGPLDPALIGATGSVRLTEPFRRHAEVALTTFLREHAPDLVSDAVVADQRPGPGLVELARGSELLVLGTRGSSGRDDLSLGSIGAYCARHATVPVALIPGDLPPPDGRLSVVVGVDGSPHSEHALKWTLDHVRRSALVTAVHVTTEGSVVGDPLSASTSRVEADARRDLEDIVARIEPHAEGHPEIEIVVVPGDPRDVLGSVVADADLLVVGARGHGMIHRLLLGSVAIALAHHPTLPTIIVPDGRF